MPSLIGSEGVIDMEALDLTIKELLLSWIIVQIILATQSSIMLHLVGATRKQRNRTKTKLSWVFRCTFKRRHQFFCSSLVNAVYFIEDTNLENDQDKTIRYMSHQHFLGPSLKSALRPPPSALAESANFRPFYVKRADFSPLPPATKKRRKVVKIRPCGGWWVGGWFPPSFSLIWLPLIDLGTKLVTWLT